MNEKLTLKLASEKLKNGEISSQELTKEYLERIKKLNPKLNAFITILEDEAMEQAKEGDRRRKNNQVLSELDGIPVAIKDNMAMEGTKTTAASKILENFIAPYDATVVSKLKNAGAVIVGKTNMDEFAMGSSTETSNFGPTKNPWDLERVPGGSSGGSAAAVAADMCVAALGSDTGGSIRQPASLCGIVGFKPTYGAVSRYGLFAMASSLDQIGPMTKTVEDAQILYDVIKGYDEKDSTSVNVKAQMSPLRSSSFEGQANVKIGVPKEYFSEGLDSEVRKIIESSIDILKKQGTAVKEISLPHTKYALSCYYIIMPVEVASNLARYDGIGFGSRPPAGEAGKSEVGNLMDTYFKTRSEGFGTEAKRRIMLGTYASSAGYIGKFYLKANKVRALIKQDFDQAFNKVDFILGPTSPEVAFKLGEKTQDPLKMYLSDIYTIAVNLAGLPAISIPAGQANPNPVPGTGLQVRVPVGLQIIGPQQSDAAVLTLAKVYEGARGAIPSPSLS